MPHTTEPPEVFQRLRDEAGWSIFLDDFSEGTKYWYAKNVRAPRHGIDILEPSPPTGRITVIVYFGEHFVNANGLLLSACFEAAQRALFLRFKDLVDASLDTFGNPEVADILQGMATLASLHALFERTPEQRKKLPPPPPPVLADREGLAASLAEFLGSTPHSANVVAGVLALVEAHLAPPEAAKP